MSCEENKSIVFKKGTKIVVQNAKKFGIAVGTILVNEEEVREFTINPTNNFAGYIEFISPTNYKITLDDSFEIGKDFVILSLSSISISSSFSFTTTWTIPAINRYSTYNFR